MSLKIHENSEYSTKCTRLGAAGWGCRIFFKGKLIVEGIAETRNEIGPCFRDLLRTIDKMGGDVFTNAARYRKWKNGNMSGNYRHEWRW